MNWLRWLTGTNPAPEIPVEFWFVDEFSLGDGQYIYNRSLMLNTTWEKVSDWASVPWGEFSLSEPIVIARLSRFGKKPVFNYYSKTEFTKHFSGFPERSAEGRNQLIDKIGAILSEEIEALEKFLQSIK